MILLRQTMILSNKGGGMQSPIRARNRIRNQASPGHIPDDTDIIEILSSSDDESTADQPSPPPAHEVIDLLDDTSDSEDDAEHISESNPSLPTLPTVSASSSNDDSNDEGSSSATAPKSEGDESCPCSLLGSTASVSNNEESFMPVPEADAANSKSESEQSRPVSNLAATKFNTGSNSDDSDDSSLSTSRASTSAAATSKSTGESLLLSLPASGVAAAKFVSIPPVLKVSATKSNGGALSSSPAPSATLFSATQRNNKASSSAPRTPKALPTTLNGKALASSSNPSASNGVAPKPNDGAHSSSPTSRAVTSGMKFYADKAHSPSRFSTVAVRRLDINLDDEDDSPFPSPALEVAISNANGDRSLSASSVPQATAAKSSSDSDDEEESICTQAMPLGKPNLPESVKEDKKDNPPAALAADQETTAAASSLVIDLMSSSDDECAKKPSHSQVHAADSVARRSIPRIVTNESTESAEARRPSTTTTAAAARDTDSESMSDSEDDGSYVNHGILASWRKKLAGRAASYPRTKRSGSLHERKPAAKRTFIPAAGAPLKERQRLHQLVQKQSDLLSPTKQLESLGPPTALLDGMARTNSATTIGRKTAPSLARTHPAPASLEVGVSKYLEDRVDEDGHIVPTRKPSVDKDGFYIKPSGRTPKGMVWDRIRGFWVRMDAGTGIAHQQKDSQTYAVRLSATASKLSSNGKADKGFRAKNGAVKSSSDSESSWSSSTNFSMHGLSRPARASGIQGTTYPKRKRTRRAMDQYFSFDTSLSEGSVLSSSDNSQRKRRKRASQKTTCSRGNLSESESDEDDVPRLDDVPHLTRTTVDKQTGLPVREFTVADCKGETLYEFKLTVGRSLIPNSGNGAFLEYLGAKVAKKECREQAEKRFNDRLAYILDTMKALHAIMPDGCLTSVKLTGSNLHGNQNSMYWPKSLEENPSDDYFCCDDDQEPAIGSLRLHASSDYLPSNKSFSKLTGKVDLGRYGPILKNDRKQETFYDVKNFIFNYEPSNWSFGVEEKLNGDKQMIDITSDATGEPHAAARRGTLMYANEVGHSKEYEQNVVARLEDRQSVHYYFEAEKPLKKGQTVELLVDYYDSYEDSRERKGYGKRNLEDGEKCDNDEATRFKRNFEEREQVEKLIGSLGTRSSEDYLTEDKRAFLMLFRLLDFVRSLHKNIHKPVAESTNAFMQHLILQKDETNVLPLPSKPSFLQWIARRRLHWISILLDKHLDRVIARLEKLLQEVGDSTSCPRSTFPYQALFDEIRNRLEDMRWNSVGQFMSQLNHAHNEYEKRLRAALVSEMNEEILCKLPCVFVDRSKQADRSELDDKLRFVDPLNEALWCPVASQLTKDLCAHVWNSDATDSITKLADAFMKSAMHASQTIRAACASEVPRLLRQLQFNSGAKLGSLVDMSYLKRFHGLNGTAPFFAAGHSTIPKGAQAAIADIQAYRDALELGCLEETSVADRLLVPTEGVFVVSKHGSFPLSSNSRGAMIPRRSTDFITGDESWYLLWQVIHVVHLFASKFLIREVGLRDFLERLCNDVGVDYKCAQWMVEEGIAWDYKLPQMSKAAPSLLQHKAPEGPESQKTERKARKRDLFHEIVWKALEGMGWTMTCGTRPNDLYFFPPGVTRRNGKNRKDFFDSSLQVLSFVRNDPRWKAKDEVVACLQQYSSCLKLLDDMKSKRAASKGQLTLQWLLAQVESSH